MSSTVLYVVASNGDVESYCEFKNAWGGAMAIWELLGKKYVPQARPHWAPSGERDYWSIHAEGALEKLFKLARTPGVMAPWESTTLLTTADTVVVPIKHVERVALAFETFFKHYEVPRAGYAFSVGAQADALRTILEDGDWRGVCWNQTTVNSGIWSRCIASEEDDGTDGECVPYNIDTMKEHWFLFGEEEAPTASETSPV
jgi:hypothetical protein